MLVLWLFSFIVVYALLVWVFSLLVVCLLVFVVVGCFYLLCVW